MDLERVNDLQAELAQHPLLNGAIESPQDLQTFMQSHVWAVWDFMSLLKGLQHKICPSGSVWYPKTADLAQASRLINSIVLNEESDLDLDGQTPISHFELYMRAMQEVGADTGPIKSWASLISNMPRESAERICKIPPQAREFMRVTQELADQGLPEQLGAFTWGRETLVPQMFEQLVVELPEGCDYFRYYLDRHIGLDGDDHGPASVKLVEQLCRTPRDLERAYGAAVDSLTARKDLWTAILKQITSERHSPDH